MSNDRENVTPETEEILEPETVEETEETAKAEAEEPAETTEEESTLFSAPRTAEKAKPGKKRLGTFFVVLLVALLLGGGVAAAYFGGLFAQPETSEVSEVSEEEPLPPLVDHTAVGMDAIQTVEIQNETGHYAFSRNEDGALAVDGFEGLPRDGEAVENMQVQYTAITPDLLIAEHATNEQLKACGLDKPAITVTVTYDDKETATFYLGRLASGSHAGYYGKLKDSDSVWLFEEEYYQVAMRADDYYIGKTLMTAPSPNSDDTTGSAKLKTLTLSGGERAEAVKMRYIQPTDDQSVQLCGKYVLEKPFFHAADGEVVSEWDTSLCGLYAAEIAAIHPTADQLDSYGLGDTATKAEMTFAVYQTTDADGKELKEPKWYNEVSYTLTLGNKTKGDQYYAMLDGVDIVYTVNAATVPWAGADYETLVNKSLFLRYITELSGIDATVGDNIYTLKMTHSTKKDENGGETATLKATLNGKAREEAQARGIYQSMMTVKRVSAAPAEATASGKPTMTLSLVSLAGETDTVFSFYPYSANRYLCVSGDGDRFLVKATDVETLANQWYSFGADEEETSSTAS